MLIPTTRQACSIAATIGAMALGAVLLPPTFAEKAPEAKQERKIVVRKELRGGKPDAASLKSRIADAKASMEARSEDLAEAKALLLQAEDALKRQDESVARALLHEAERLLGPDFMSFPFPGKGPFLGGSPDPDTGWFGAFAPGLDIDVDVDWQHGDPGHTDEMFTWSSGLEAPAARKLEIRIDGDQMTVDGEDADGQPFHLEGSKAEVKAQLKDRGIGLQEVDGKAPFRFRMPVAPVPPFFAPHGSVHSKGLPELSKEARQDLEQQIAQLAADAAELLKRGKTDEGLEKLREAFGQSVRLGIGLDGQQIRIEKRVIESDEADAPRVTRKQKVEKEDSATQPEASDERLIQ